MSKPTLFLALVRREARAMLAHWMLSAGWLIALALGVAVHLYGGESDGTVWVVYQVIYYMIPLVSLLGTIMIVRQDLGEAPLLALLPHSSLHRVLAKATASTVYFAVGLALLIGPSLAGSLAWRDALSLGAGGLLLIVTFVAVGVCLALRSRHEVRAYLGGLATWILFLFGSGALAYGAHHWLAPAHTPIATLAALMVNPIESFRIFAFFGLSTVPVNPHTLNPVGLWWMAHPLIWLALISLPYTIAGLLGAGWNLRYRS